jgi:outer membrane protein assembly factor BamB
MVGEADADDTKQKEWGFDSGSSRYEVDISADGEDVVVGSDNGIVYLFNKDSSAPRWNYTTGYDVKSVAISSNGKYIAAGSDNEVYLFSTKIDTPLWNYSTGYNSIISVDISSDGRYIAAGSSGSESGNIYLFDRDSSTPLWNHTVGDAVSSVIISDNGDYIASGSNDGKIYLFDKDSSTPLWIYDEELTVSSLHISISADGENMVAGMRGSSNCSFYVFNKNSNVTLWNYTASNSIYQCPVVISADGEYIAAGSGQKFYLFDKDRSKPLWDYDTGGSYAMAVAISGDGDYIVAGSGGSMGYNSPSDTSLGLGKLYLFDKGSGTPLWYHDSSIDSWVHSASDGYEAVGISADGEYIVSGGWEVKFFTKENTILDLLSEFFGEVGFSSIVVLAILAGLFYFRKDTGTDNTTNKLLKIGLYGVSIITLLVSLPIMFYGLFPSSAWGCLPGLWVLMFAILFAVTGSFLGYETYDPSPASYSYKSSIPSSKPIFGNKPKTPIFTPQNEMTAIECPGCSAQMDVPKLGTIQDVTCNECGLSGEIEI